MAGHTKKSVMVILILVFETLRSLDIVSSDGSVEVSPAFGPES
jgi:hypothetical protein